MSKTVRIHKFGGPEVLELEEHADPIPGAGEARLRIKAIGINRTEETFRSGRAAQGPLPTQLGFEAAGEIEALGPRVDGYGVGDRVAVIAAFGISDYGLYGETSLAPARSLVKLSSDQTFEDAAATWVAFATAWAGLIDIAQLAKGQTVLLPAATSPVGLAAIQIARRVGAIPIALTRTSRKISDLQAFGPLEVIATEETDVVTEVQRITSGRGADVLFDPVMGPTFTTLMGALSFGAKVVVFGALSGQIPPLPLLALMTRGVTLSGLALPIAMRNDLKLKAVKTFVSEGFEAGAFRNAIAKVFPFDEIADAHRYLALSGHVGKIVVTP